MRDTDPFEVDWNERESFVFYGSFEMFRPGVKYTPRLGGVENYHATD